MTNQGKGSRNRTSNNKKYRENYDEIFRKSNFQKQKEKFVKTCAEVAEVNGEEFDKALDYLSTRKSSTKTPYQKYLENFYNYNAISHGELPLTEYEFNNPKDFQ